MKRLKNRNAGVETKLIMVPCSDCPDGYMWTEQGPTEKECQTCGGTARVLVHQSDNDLDFTK